MNCYFNHFQVSKKQKTLTTCTTVERFGTATLSRLTTLGFATAALFCSLTGAAAATIYQTGFEAPTYSLGSLNGQDNWSTFPNNAAGTVENTVVHGGTQAVEITPGSNYVYGIVHNAAAALSSSLVLTLSNYANFSSAGTASYWTAIGGFYSGGGNTLLNVDTSGRLVLSINGINTATGITISDGVWNQYGLSVNYANDTITGYYNGAVVGPAVSFNPSTDLNLSDVQSYAQANSAMTPQVGYFDDFQITTAPAPTATPEPSTIFATVLGAVFLGALPIWRRRLTS